MQHKIKRRRRLIIAGFILSAVVISGVLVYKAYDNYMMQTVYSALRDGRCPDGMSEEQFIKYYQRLTESENFKN